MAVWINVRAEDLPASILKKHPNVSIYLDSQAASLLPQDIQKELLR